MRTDEIRLQDILNAIQQIEIYIEDSKASFYDSKLLQSGVLYHRTLIKFENLVGWAMPTLP